MTRLNTVRQRIADIKAWHAKLAETLNAENRAFTDAERTQVSGEKAELLKLEAEETFLAEQQATQKQAVAAAAVTVIKDNAAEKPWGPTVPQGAGAKSQAEARRAGLGQWAMAVKSAAEGRGTDPRLLAAASGMNSIVPSEGGFAVPTEFAPGIEKTMFESGQILSRVDVRSVSGDSIVYQVLNETSRVAGSRGGGVLGYWVEQGNAPTATKPALARLELRLKKVGALGYMTDELVADAAALGGELERLFSEELTFQVEDAIFQGDGAGKPLGLTGAPCTVEQAKESGQVAATIVTANLSKMWSRLPARSKTNAVWLINVDCEPQLDILTVPAGTGAVEARFVTYDATGAIRIKGRPVIHVEYAQTCGTAKDIVLADLSQYRLITKGGIQQASSIHVLFTTGEQTFRAFYRCDGQPVPRAAITPFKGSNTLSPFITLATRS
jgi:HK97 family phage major capsid protein